MKTASAEVDAGELSALGLGPMDPTATFVIALIGAISGLGSLLWQFISWRRSGAVVRIHCRPVRTKNDDVVTLTGVKVLVQNRGRHPAQIRNVGLSNRLMPRRTVPYRWPRKFARRVVNWARGRDGLISITHAGNRMQFPQQLQGLSTREYEIRFDNAAPWLEEVERVYPFAEMGNGKIKRGRRFDLDSWRGTEKGTR